MSAAAAPYELAHRHALRGRFGDLLTADVRVMLTGAAYTPAGTDEWATQPAAYEVSGPGYTTGGAPLAGRVVDYDTAAAVAVLGADDTRWAGAMFAARWAVVYVATGNPATSPLISYVDLGALVSPGGDDYTLTWPAGVWRLGKAAP